MTAISPSIRDVDFVAAPLPRQLTQPDLGGSQFLALLVKLDDWLGRQPEQVRHERLPVLVLTGELAQLEYVKVVLLGSNEVTNDFAVRPWLKAFKIEYSVQKSLGSPEGKAHMIPVRHFEDGRVVDRSIGAEKIYLRAGIDRPGYCEEFSVSELNFQIEREQSKPIKMLEQEK